MYSAFTQHTNQVLPVFRTPKAKSQGLTFTVPIYSGPILHYAQPI